MKDKRTLTKIILVILIFVMTAVAVFSAVQILTKHILPQNKVQEDSYVPLTKTVNGVEYFPKQDISVFLLMGIDREGPAVSSGSYNNDGAADMVALAVFDDTNKTYNVLMLSRDTMLDFPVLGLKGETAGTRYAQLALSHTYGDGLAKSCENTEKAVSDLLLNVDIDYYMSMNMDIVSVVTDAVGGVKVNVTDDFSKVDPSIPMGEVTLKGDQALSFVRNRQGVGDQMNASRMNRQKEFMNGFMDAAMQKLDGNQQKVLEMYNNIAQYIVSDCPVSSFTDIINKCLEYELEEIISLEGENKMGEYMEFYPDKDKLQDLALKLFYIKK